MENETAITPELTANVDALNASVERLGNEDELRMVIMNAAAHAKLRGDEAITKDLRRLGVTLFTSDGAPRPVADIITEAAQKNQLRQHNRLRSEGKLVFMPKEVDNVRITASGAVYITTGKEGKNGQTAPWRRVKGQAAMEIKQAIKDAEAKAAQEASAAEAQPVVTQ